MINQYLFDGHFYNVRSIPKHHSESQQYEIRAAVGLPVLGYVAYDLEYIVVYGPYMNTYQGSSIHENWVGSFDEAMMWAISQLIQN